MRELQLISFSFCFLIPSLASADITVVDQTASKEKPRSAVPHYVEDAFGSPMPGALAVESEDGDQIEAMAPEHNINDRRPQTGDQPKRVETGDDSEAQGIREHNINEDERRRVKASACANFMKQIHAANQRGTLPTTVLP